MQAPCLAAAAASAAPGLPSLRWAHERGPPQRCALPRPLLQHWLRQRRPGGGCSDMACRTLEPGRLQLGGLLAFQPSSSGGSSGAAERPAAPGTPDSGSGGNGLPPNGGGFGRASLPTETFQQLRQAVLTSLDIADNAEHTIDYEDGGAELQEDILLESCPSVKEVGKSVFEVRLPARLLCCYCDGRQSGYEL